MVIAGKNLIITDASAELTTGLVLLETLTVFRTSGYLLLFEYNHDGVQTDTGFDLTPTIAFGDDGVVPGKEFQSLIPNVGVLEPEVLSFVQAGAYNGWTLVETPVPGLKIKLALQWSGGDYSALSDLTIHLVPNSANN